MTTNELIQKLAGCLDAEQLTLTADTQLDELDGWDSLGRLGIANLFSDAFGISVDRMALKNCQRLGEVVDMVKDRLEG